MHMRVTRPLIAEAADFSEKCRDGLAQMLADADVQFEDCAGGLFSSSNPGSTPDLQRTLSELASGEVHELSRELAESVSNAYDRPEQIGSDRLVNARAARQIWGCPCIVADLGSCITVDVIDEAGVFVGGAIAPGLPVLKAGFVTRTPHLQESLDATEPPGDVSLPGRSSEDCIALGLYAAIRGTTRELCTDFKARYGDLPIVLTGGDWPLVDGHLSGKIIADELLTLKGLALLDCDR